MFGGVPSGMSPEQMKRWQKRQAGIMVGFVAFNFIMAFAIGIVSQFTK